MNQRTRGRAFRAANVAMLLVFLLSVAVQYNDPDGLLWMFYYAYAAGVAALAIARIYTVAAPIGLIAYLIGFYYYLPKIPIIEAAKLLKEPKMSSPDVEMAREAFGLLICAVWMAVVAWVWWKQRSSRLVD